MGSSTVPAVINQRERLKTLLDDCHCGSIKASIMVRTLVSTIPANCICSTGIISFSFCKDAAKLRKNFHSGVKKATFLTPNCGFSNTILNFLTPNFTDFIYFCSRKFQINKKYHYVSTESYLFIFVNADHVVRSRHTEFEG
jgi:hypothetical protein